MKRSDFEIEICANSIQSVVAAADGGANRVELCDNLFEGGTTPSIGLQTIAKKNTNIDIFPIIRPRGGDFLYSDSELDIMLYDIKKLGRAGADGFVIGGITEDGKIDYEKNARLVDACKDLPVTFHRAFDMTVDPLESLETCIKLGISRILTSGQQNKAIDGLPLLAKLSSLASDRIKIMVGSGIDESNIKKIAEKTGIKSFHMSLRTGFNSKMKFQRPDIFMGGLKQIPEYENKYTDKRRVRNIIEDLQNL